MRTSSRRVFFKQISYGGAAVALSPALFTYCHGVNSKIENSFIDIDGILPVAFINDAANLILKKGDISVTTIEALTADIHQKIPGNNSRIAASMSFPEKSVLEFLGQIKKDWNTRNSKMDLEEKYSLSLGWIIYSNIQDCAGELYNKLIGKGYHYDEIRICQDTFILRQISNVPRDDNATCSQTELSELFQIMLPRTITRMHTFIPDKDNGAKWVIYMTNWRRANKDLMNKYAGAYINPDKDNIKKFVYQPGFYYESDKIIQLARNIRIGAQVSSEEISSTLISDPGNSLYAKSLVKGIQKAELVDQFFTGEMSFSDFSHQISAI